MIDKSTGKFIEEPPKYECIKCNSKFCFIFNKYLYYLLTLKKYKILVSNNNLNEYTSISEHFQHGKLMSLEGLLKFFQE